jgi:hypothetical protein
MILLTTRMKICAAKRLEFSPPVALPIGSMKTELGCLRFDFCRNLNDNLEIQGITLEYPEQLEIMPFIE